MGLFGGIKDKQIAALKLENKRLKANVKRLEKRGDLKDKYFLEVISDGLRHGSKLAAKHMRDRRDYLNKKY